MVHSPPSFPSPYLPPRAGAAAPLWRGWFGLRRGLLRLLRAAHTPLGIDLLRPGAGVPFSFRALALVLLVPGLGFVRFDRPWLHRAALAAFPLLLLLALACQGQPAAGLLLGSALGLHVFSISLYLDAVAPPRHLLTRLLRNVALMLAFLVLVRPPLETLATHLSLPVRDGPDLLLVNPRDRLPPLRPGERIAYETPAVHQPPLHIQAGIYLGEVVALPGQTVEFTPDALLVDGAALPRRPAMPLSGRHQVPPGSALIWPRRFARLYGPAVLPFEFALVPDSALVGRPRTRWFWRTFPPSP